MSMGPKLRSSPKLISSIDVSGFVGIMLFLLWLFMFPGMMHIAYLPGGAVVDLSKVAGPKPVPHARREDAIMVSVNRSGNIFFGYDRISREILPERISKAVKSGSEPVVYIRADARTKYKNVKDVMNEVAVSGLQNVMFLVDEQRKP
jgi:biopolymer transport protein TolR